MNSKRLKGFKNTPACPDAHRQSLMEGQTHRLREGPRGGHISHFNGHFYSLGEVGGNQTVRY